MDTNKISILFIVVLMLASCRDQVCENLLLKLELYECNNQKCPVDLKDIFKKPWDQLYIFHGFNTPEDITDAIGFDYSGDAIYDHTRLILEISNNKILRKTKTECLEINLDKVLNSGYYKKDRYNSVITVSVSGQTDKMYTFEN